MTIDTQTAAIVCTHIANESSRICVAVRSEPLEEADSGWQFLCGQHEENLNEAALWSLGEVLELEPSLWPFIERLGNSKLTRDQIGGEWREMSAEPDN